MHIRTSGLVGVLALLATALGAQDEKQAAAALEKAMELASDGKYATASAAYRRITERWAGTKAAAIAHRRAGDTAFLGWSFLVRSGDPANRVDIVMMGDGFTLREQNRFDDMAKQVPKIFGRHKLFSEYYGYFNFLRANLASKDGDIDAYGREYETALESKIMGNNAPWVVVSHVRVMAMLEELPEHDGLALVFVGAQGYHGTGGAGVGIVAGRDDDTIVHEWGHAFAALGDEYSTFTFERGVAPAPNISRSDDPELVPWRHWIEADAPGIGVYRGGQGHLKGAYRPVASGCAMERGQIFCKVCREALVLRIYSLVDPIDGCAPAAHAFGHTDEVEPERDGSYRFEVEIMQPASHGLEVRWWVLPEASAPRSRVVGGSDRRQRGVLPPIEARPDQSTPRTRQRVQRFRWSPEPGTTGRFRVVCRVRDHTDVEGQSWPWVLRDELGVLESERAWWVRVR